MAIKMAEELLHTNLVFGVESAWCRLAGERSTTEEVQSRWVTRGPPGTLEGNRLHLLMGFKKKKRKKATTVMVHMSRQGNAVGTHESELSCSIKSAAEEISLSVAGLFFTALCCFCFLKMGSIVQNSPLAADLNLVLSSPDPKEPTRFRGKVEFLSSKFELKE